MLFSICGLRYIQPRLVPEHGRPLDQPLDIDGLSHERIPSIVDLRCFLYPFLATSNLLSLPEDAVDDGGSSMRYLSSIGTRKMRDIEAT
jgi:hypothetical protein